MAKALTGNPDGRPLLWKNPEDLQKQIDGYFESTDRITLAGLAVYLGIDRQTLYNYAERDVFFDTIKKARARVENCYEERMIYDNQPTGVIFALKNMGWKDRQDITSDDARLGEYKELSDEKLDELIRLKSPR